MKLEVQFIVLYKKSPSQAVFLKIAFWLKNIISLEVRREPVLPGRFYRICEELTALHAFSFHKHQQSFTVFSLQQPFILLFPFKENTPKHSYKIVFKDTGDRAPFF
ncbi:hypothetical protein [Bartonella sp. AA126HLJHH]|uniref:hypothetical protein n=1 Tax=Bartonella sp. AA126HLJHH TaxID=3243426 RepID=UPI0035D08B82